MKLSDLSVRLAARFPQFKADDSKFAAKLILDAMQSALAARKRIEIRGFGSFTLTYRKPRIARNPKTGATFETQGKWLPHFKAGKEMRERVSIETTKST